MKETTLVLVKPGGVQRNLIGEIIRRIEARDLQVTGLKLIQASRTTVEQHYAEHVGKPFFDGVCTALSSSPIVALSVSGINSVKAVRAMMGATNPIEATPGTVRGDLALTMDDNLVHSSANPEDAARELGLWFPEGQLR